MAWAWRVGLGVRASLLFCLGAMAVPMAAARGCFAIRHGVSRLLRAQHTQMARAAVGSAHELCPAKLQRRFRARAAPLASRKPIWSDSHAHLDQELPRGHYAAGVRVGRVHVHHPPDVHGATQLALSLPPSARPGPLCAQLPPVGVQRRFLTSLASAVAQDDLEEIQREIDILKATERVADAAAAKYSPPAQAADLQPFKKPVQDGERS